MEAEDHIGRDAGKKKPRQWQRDRKDQRFREIDDSSDGEGKESAPPARNLHVIARIPDKKALYRTGSKQEPLPPESDEEKLARLEKRIQSDEFSDAERKFFELMVKKYPHELQIAKEKIEKRGGTVDDKWAAVVRTSYIGDRKRAGLDKDRWEPKIPLAPEKADLFEEYLLLKLPVGIPEEKKAEDNPEKNENIYSGEKSKEFLRLLKVAGIYFRKWLKQSGEWGDGYGDKETRKKMLVDQLQVALTGLMAEDLELKKHFTQESAPWAVERVINYIKQFNNIK